MEVQKSLSRDLDFDIRKMITIGTLMVESPFYVLDTSLQHLFSTELLRNPDGGVSVTIDDSVSYMGINALEIMKNSTRVERELQKPYISMETPDGKRLYCYNVYLLDHFSCCAFFMENEHAFSDADLALADYFFKCFEAGFQKYLRIRGLEERPDTIALRKLLNNIPLRNADYEDVFSSESERYRLFILKEILPITILMCGTRSGFMILKIMPCPTP